jgi:hypothetical protein
VDEGFKILSCILLLLFPLIDLLEYCRKIVVTRDICCEHVNHAGMSITMN